MWSLGGGVWTWLPTNAWLEALLTTRTSGLLLPPYATHYSLPLPAPLLQPPTLLPPRPSAAPSLTGVNMADLQVYKVLLALAILIFWSAFWVVHLIGIIYG